MIRRSLLSGCLAVAIALPGPVARAHSGPSELSALSLLPVAISVTAPLMIFAAGSVLTVVAVDASVHGTVWVLERASDGARASVRLSAQAVGGLSVAVGTSVLVTATAAGWLLSAAGEVIAFVPNELGKALLYNERVTR